MRLTWALAAILSAAIMLIGCDVLDDNFYDTAKYSPPAVDDDAATDDDDDTGQVDDDDQSWPELPKWLRDRPYLQDRVRWSQKIDMAAPPAERQLGCIGVGNGKVFGILSNQYPLASWHNLGGPDYQRNDKWFSDKVPWLLAGGRYQSPTAQLTSRVRDADIAIIAAANDNLEWTSVNFAPRGDVAALAEQALLTVWIVRNLADHPIKDIELEIQTALGGFANGRLAETDLADRRLEIKPLGVATYAGEDRKRLRFSLGDLKAGAEQVVVLPSVFFHDGEDADAVFAAIDAAGVDPLLEATLAWWQDWASQMTVIETPDAKFNDLIPSLALSIKVNQTWNGGNSQMSQYSNVWLRDTHGPSLLLPLIGLGDDYRDMLDYHWVASLQRGGLANAYPANIDLTDVPAEPAWRFLAPMEGRTKAEGPSALVLQYENYLKATGDWDTIAARYGMLYHAVMHQQFVNGCLQYFSSDETFEDVMQAAFGWNILKEPDTEVLSLYSSALMMRAAGFMAEVAAHVGQDQDAAEFTQLAADVKRCMNEVYWLPEQGFYGIEAITATLAPVELPYEDVSTSLLWLDALTPNDPRAVSNFEQIKEMLGHRNGSLWTHIFFVYNALFYTVRDAVQTGMAHGYWLNNLDKMFHPDADKAFDLWKSFFTKAGATDEAVIVDDYSHLTLLREPTGFLGDTSARYRSWEAGIMGHALLHHLTGYDADVSAGTAKLAPHLPRKWDHTAFRGLAYGNGRFDLEVTALDNGGRSIVIAADDQTAFALSLAVPMDGDFAGATVNGETVGAAAQTNKYGRTVVRFDPIAVAAGASVEVLVNAVK